MGESIAWARVMTLIDSIGIEWAAASGARYIDIA